MTRRGVAAPVVGAAIWSAIVSTSPLAARGASHETIAAMMRSNMVGRVLFDGDAISDVLMTGECQTKFVTPKGSTIIDWRRIGNAAARDVGSREVTPLDQGPDHHEISVARGELADRVGSSIVVLALDCQPRRR